MKPAHVARLFQEGKTLIREDTHRYYKYDEGRKSVLVSDEVDGVFIPSGLSLYKLFDGKWADGTQKVQLTSQEAYMKLQQGCIVLRPHSSMHRKDFKYRFEGDILYACEDDISWKPSDLTLSQFSSMKGFYCYE